MYDITFLNSSYSLYEIYKGTNDAVGMLYHTLILFALFIIIFLVFKSMADSKTILFIDSFFCTFLSVLSFFAGLIRIQTVWIFVILLVGSIILNIFGKNTK